MKVKVEKVSKNENTFVSKLENLDHMPTLPTVGQSLLLLGTEFPEGIRTSCIEEISEIDDGWIVKTMNSEYKILRVESNAS